MRLFSLYTKSHLDFPNFLLLSTLDFWDCGCERECEGGEQARAGRDE